MCSANTSKHLTLLKPTNQWTQIWQQHVRFLGVVDELLVNPIDFHVDDPSRLINGRSDRLQEGLP
jgi:hypothetical protein